MPRKFIEDADIVFIESFDLMMNINQNRFLHWIRRFPFVKATSIDLQKYYSSTSSNGDLKEHIDFLQNYHYAKRTIFFEQHLTTTNYEYNQAELEGFETTTQDGLKLKFKVFVTVDKNGSCLLTFYSNIKKFIDRDEIISLLSLRKFPSNEYDYYTLITGHQAILDPINSKHPLDNNYKVNMIQLNDSLEMVRGCLYYTIQRYRDAVINMYYEYNLNELKKSDNEIKYKRTRTPEETYQFVFINKFGGGIDAEHGFNKYKKDFYAIANLWNDTKTIKKDKINEMSYFSNFKTHLSIVGFNHGLQISDNLWRYQKETLGKHISYNLFNLIILEYLCLIRSKIRMVDTEIARLGHDLHKQSYDSLKHRKKEIFNVNISLNKDELYNVNIFQNIDSMDFFNYALKKFRINDELRVVQKKLKFVEEIINSEKEERYISKENLIKFVLIILAIPATYPIFSDIAKTFLKDEYSSLLVSASLTFIIGLLIFLSVNHEKLLEWRLQNSTKKVGITQTKLDELDKTESTKN